MCLPRTGRSSRSSDHEVSVYVLNMGQTVKIVDLAGCMIRLSGLEPGRDVAVAFTGTRPGERLHEILFAREEETVEIGIPGIVAAKPTLPSIDGVRGLPARLEQAHGRNERSAMYEVLRDPVPKFRGRRRDGPAGLLHVRVL
jgi:FlaA1/EpsC-like NDP-sugar epimerase